jgi:hypothetical protein
VQGQVVRSSSAAEQPTSQKSEQPATVWATLGPTLRAASADPSPPKAVFAKNVFGVNW